jgi:pilus assembly protein Flp/PilA
LNGAAYLGSRRHNVPLFYAGDASMNSLALKVRKFLVSEDGPTAVEYAIMLALIVIVCLTAIQSIGQNANSAFEDIAADLNNARTGVVD